jgi:lipoprotein signal peptidase
MSATDSKVAFVTGAGRGIGAAIALALAQRGIIPVLAVRDWIHFQLEGIIDWPIFNLADSWLVIGAGLLLLLSLRPPVAERPARTDPPTATERPIT